MGDTNSGVGRIDALAAVSAGTIDIDTEIFFFDFKILFGSFWKNGIRSYTNT